ncbi:MAG: hypothetical protein OJJ54_03810 [Pseudonocardia sp.]|nr:hypothetical protein [Pseudonocardia sp.]
MTRSPLGWIYALIITLTVFQRFVIPGQVMSVSLPVAFLVVLVLSLQGHLVPDRTRVLFWAAAMAACCLASVLSWPLVTIEPSISSLYLLLAIYLPLCFRASPALRARFPDVLEFFQRVMVLGAVLCIGQWAAQMAGWPFEDLLDFVPSQFLYSTEYNLSYPLYYGSDIYKANGIVFLEASFASQFLALAAIIQLLRGGAKWRLVVFGAAILTTMAGTGLLLLGAGLVTLAIRRGGQWSLRAASVVLVAVVVVGLTPAGSLLAERSAESSSSGSSGNIRFVAPYETVLAAAPSDVASFLLGRGPGSVTRDLDYFNPGGRLANYPALPKLVGEYGLPAMLVFVAFILLLFFRRVPSPTLGVCAVMVYFVLSGSLLQPQTVYLCWLMTGLFAAGPYLRPTPTAARRLPQRGGTAGPPGPQPITR